MSNPDKCKNVNGRKWMICVACGGRLHMPDCTSKKNKNKDCCKERHKILHDMGFTKGIIDSAEKMLGSHWEPSNNKEQCEQVY